MKRGMLVVAVMALAVIAAGCSSGEDAVDDSMVEGVISEVTGDLTDVSSFVVLDDQGKSHQFTPEPGLLFYGGPLSHLRDHVVTGQRVTVTFESGAYGEMTATLIEHADGDETHETTDHSDHSG